MSIELYRHSDNAHIVTVGRNEYFFSYATCIAFRGLIDGKYHTIRRANDWGPTTGKHFNQLGAKEFDLLPTAEFVALVESTSVPQVAA